jgi:arginyl-tRNA--protein-N-Asp/Glu arginylyltransferase
MHADPVNSKVFFYTTSPLACPYIEGEVERRIVTELTGKSAEDLHNSLSKSGFRRSHYMAYAPACPDCSACIPVRIVSQNFKPTKSQKRVLKKFSNITVVICEAKATQEQFLMFEAYQQARHGDGDMASMDYFDYRSMVEETPVKTSIVEFRDNERLVGAMLIDHLSDGLSAVYSFFLPESQYTGFGNYMVLWSISKSLEMDLPYIYLGYLVRECAKMSYKEKYSPLEGCVDGQWCLLGDQNP